MLSMPQILYEDNHLLVVVKPRNMPTQADQSGDRDVLNTLKHYIKVTYDKPGNAFLGLVHRLDRPVGGVMVFAKTSKAASRLSNNVRTRAFDKTYLAVVHGRIDPARNTLTHFLIKNNRLNKVFAVGEHNEGAKKAILNYKVIATQGQLSLVEVDLLTGRPHQIRVQLSEIGHPLFGDQKYGAYVNKRGQQIALWSTKVSFPHPTTKEWLSFHASPLQTNDYPWTLWDEAYYSSTYHLS